MVVLHEAVFTGKASIVQVVLDQISDNWPAQIKKEYLDARTAHGYTAYMIACSCGFVEVAGMLEAKGCSTELINDFGKTGKKLADAMQHEQEFAAVRPWDRADRFHLHRLDHPRAMTSKGNFSI